MKLRPKSHVLILICFQLLLWKSSKLVVHGLCGPLIPKPSQNVQVTCLGSVQCKTAGVKIPNGSRVEIKCLDNYETRDSTDGRRVLTCDYFRWIGQALFDEIRCKIKCGRPAVENVGLIIKGAETERLRWPWHIALFINDFYACGGSIINPIGQELYILTAVHCVTSADGTPLDLKVFKVVIGAISSSLSENMRTPNTQILRVKKIVRHDNYDLQRHLEDIALIQTDKPIRVTPYSLPVCLPSNEIMVSGQVKASVTAGVVVGFGSTTGLRAPASEKLHEVTLPVVSTDACHDILDQRPSISQICAGTPNGANACSGDSGGGLVFREDHPIRYTIQGIVSSTPREYRCNGVSIFTRVFNFLHWIELESDKIIHTANQEGIRGRGQIVPHPPVLPTATTTRAPFLFTIPTTKRPLVTFTIPTTTPRPRPTTTAVARRITTPTTIRTTAQFKKVNKSKALRDYEEVALKEHNAYRSRHSAPPVSIDPELSRSAQQWADHLIQTKSSLKTGAKCSENLFEFSGRWISPTEVTQYAISSWYDRRKEYRSSDPQPSTFTQLVWKASKKIGVGVSTKDNRSIVAVCYSPPGNFNFIGDGGKSYRDNVTP